jgi:hypothetical protein
MTRLEAIFAFAIAGTGVAATVLVAACGSTRPISRIEDKARLDVPIAICRQALGPNDVSDAGVAPPEAIWRVVMPTFRGFGSTLGPSDTDCAGGVHSAAPGGGVLGSPALAADDTVLVAGDEGQAVVWLRAFRSPDGIASGPLAFLRTRASEVDLYALGTYRGNAKHSRFSMARVGSTRVITVIDDGCESVKVDAECDSNLHVYVVSGARIEETATTPTQRLRYGTLKGVNGRVQFRLSTDPPVFDKLTIKVHEKVQVRDAADEDVRGAEGDRVFNLGPDGRLTPAQDSVWSQLHP